MGRVSRYSAAALPSIMAIAAALLTNTAVAATITVDFARDVDTDDGQCVLREAIINANNDDQSGSTDCEPGVAADGRDTIVFDPSTDGTAISIGIGGTGDDVGVAGDFDVTDALEIHGNGPARTIIDGKGMDRVFDAHAFLGLLGMTVRGGEAAAGAGVLVRGGNARAPGCRRARQRRRGGRRHHGRFRQRLHAGVRDP